MSIVLQALVEALEESRTKDSIQEFDLDRVRKATLGAFKSVENRLIVQILEGLLIGGKMDPKATEVMMANFLIKSYIEHYPDVQAMIDSIKDSADKMKSYQFKP